MKRSTKVVRRIAIGVLVALMWVVLFVPQHAAASSALDGWPVQSEQGRLFQDIVVHANRSVTVMDCDDSAAMARLRTWRSDGLKVSDIASPDEVECAKVVGRLAADPYSNMVYTFSGGLGSDPYVYRYRKLVAFSGNQQQWSVDLPCRTSSVDSIVVGADRGVYVLYDNMDCETPTSSDPGKRLLGIDPNTHQVKFDISLGFSSAYVIPKVGVYGSGIAVYNESLHTVVFYDYDGVENVGLRYTVDLGIDRISDWEVTQTGSLYVMLARDNSNGDPCFGQLSTLLFHSGDGNDTSWNLWNRELCEAGNIIITPQGVATLVISQVPQGYRQVNLMLVTSASTEVVTLPTANSWSALQSDSNGNLLLSREYISDSSHFDVGILLFSPQGAVKASFTTESWDDEGGDFSGMIGGMSGIQLNAPSFAKGAVYARIRHDVDSSDVHDKFVYKIPFAELGDEINLDRLFDLDDAVDTPVNYVALGDSFSSGEGVPPFLAGTDVHAVNECHRSNVAYPELLDRDMSLPLTLTTFAACSGAKTENILSSGQWKEPKQLSSVHANTKVVTLTIGGNDAGFEQFVTQCLFADCSVGAVRKPFFDKVTRLGPALSKVYARVLTKSKNNAEVYVLGYPQLLPISGCNLTDGWMSAFNKLVKQAHGAYAHGVNATTTELASLALIRKIGKTAKLTKAQVNNLIKAGKFKFSPAEVATARSFVSALNRKISTTVGASSARLHYLSATGVKSPFSGHELCTSAPYFNGLDPLHRVYSYHPNALGQQAYAELAKSSLG